MYPWNNRIGEPMKPNHPSSEAQKALTFTSVRISNEHDRLNSLYACLVREIDRGAPYAAQNCFIRLRGTLNGHFDVEDRVHFPVVRKFRPAFGSLIETLTEDHSDFRADMEIIERLLSANDLKESKRLLTRFADRLLLHECAEETLIADLDLQHDE